MRNFDPSPCHQTHLYQNCHYCHHTEGCYKAHQWLDMPVLWELGSTEPCESCWSVVQEYARKYKLHCCELGRSICRQLLEDIQDRTNLRRLHTPLHHLWIEFGMEERDIVHWSFSGVKLNNEDDHNDALTPFRAKFRHSLAILLKLVLVLVLVEEVGVKVLEEERKMKLRRAVKV